MDDGCKELVGYQAAIIFGIQFILWIVSSFLQTEKLFDITGNFKYLYSFLYNPMNIFY